MLSNGGAGTFRVHDMDILKHSVQGGKEGRFTSEIASEWMQRIVYLPILDGQRVSGPNNKDRPNIRVTLKWVGGGERGRESSTRAPSCDLNRLLKIRKLSPAHSYPRHQARFQPAIAHDPHRRRFCRPCVVSFEKIQ